MPQVRRETLSWNDVDKLIDHLVPQFEREFEAMLVITRGGIFPTVENEPWFVAKDVIEALGYADASAPAKVCQGVPTQWKGVKRIHTLGGAQELLCLSEQGLYFFLARSDKPKALPFQM